MHMESGRVLMRAANRVEHACDQLQGCLGVQLACRPRTPAAAAACPSSSAATRAYNLDCKAHPGAVSLQDWFK